ncbi:MAG: hypothetical protein GY841_17360 [FCB group bacterium]|nr:hypothetical protein [FCB group bacterium]
MGGLQLLIYISILFFVVVVGAKMIKIVRMPLHVRWDLYPIPHEKGKGAYGGSYYEELDWWTKPANFSLLSEIKAMLKEIILVHSVYENNRPLWVFSFPFHLGMYSLLGFVALMILGAVLGLFDITISAASTSILGQTVHYLTLVLGTAGWILAIVGAFGLFVNRLFGSKLRAATVFSDYINLLFLLSVFVAGFVSWQTADPTYSVMRGYMQNLISFEAAGILPTTVAVQFWLLAALMFYFPFTHMTHMFAKYLTYHKVRWDDEPNTRGGKIESAVNEQLGYRLDWSAPHIKTGGTWGEAATAPEEDE